MFDGIDELVLPAPDLNPLVSLYRDRLGFALVSDDVPDPRWGALWGLTEAPTREVLLGKPHSAGGWIRLVEAPGLPSPAPAGRPDRPGPYALDFYLRDAAATEDDVTEHGGDFLSEAVHYSLPGTDIPVRERMLAQPHSGLLHAFVQYRPRGTRCVIDHDSTEAVSEVVAAVFLTDDLPGARRFATDVLGAHPYFDGRFDGPAVERMLGLVPGEGFTGTLFRGPGSRNARLEFAETVPGRRRDPEQVRRVVAVCTMDDLDGLAGRLAGSEHGHLSGDLTLDGIRHIGFTSRYGATFVFRERRALA
ncbi:VOC family protein [Nocardioides alcanivorans]|uniref:VOC family protein n=1 Tax=Nocardioides alcanivorans TaxID=2897352 RepID=UPI001F4264F2|nr:VOC family protein [Nocardioides alcanivorans]